MKDLDGQSEPDRLPTRNSQLRNFKSIESQAAETIYKGKRGQTLDEYRFPDQQRTGGKDKFAAETPINGQEVRAIEMALIAEQRATPEPRNALKTAGAPQNGLASGKKRLKKRFEHTPVAAPYAVLGEDAGILEDEDRVEKELAIDNFLQPAILNQDPSLSPDAVTEGEKKMRNDESGYFDFDPKEADNFFREIDEPATRKQKSEGGKLKSVLDSGENSSIINSDIIILTVIGRF